MRRIYFALSASFFALVLSTFPAFATDNISVEPPGGLVISINDVLTFLVNAAFIIAVILALVYLIWGGINWITSGGDTEAVASARNRIIAAIIGLVIVLLAYFILDFVIQLLGFGSITNIDIPTLAEPVIDR